MQRGGQQRGGRDSRRPYQSGSGGRDVRSHGGGDYNRNTALNERQLPECEKPIDKLFHIYEKSMKLEKYAKGRDGHPLEVIANHYCLQFESKACYLYYVEIKLAQVRDNGSSGSAQAFKEQKMRKLSQRENFKVIQSLANQWLDVFADRILVFDGNKRILTGEKLSINDGQQVSRNIAVKIDGYEEKTYEVLIQFTNQINMSLLNDFYEGRLDAKNENFQEVLLVLELILRFIPSQTHTPVGRGLYTRDNQIYISNNAVMVLGHYQTVNITEVGLTFVVNPDTKFLRFSGPLLQFIANIIGQTNKITNLHDLKRISFDERLISTINCQLSGLVVFTEYVNDIKRNDTCDHMIVRKANEVQFQRVIKDGQKEWITVENYFLDHFKIRLNYENIPLVLMRGGKDHYLPVEVCYVCPEQPLPKKMITADMRQQIIKNSSCKPLKRFNDIHNSVKTIVNQSKNLLNAFGLRIIEKQILIDARELNAPQLEGNLRQIKEGISLKEWSFINLSPNLQNRIELQQLFIKELIKMGAKMGVNIRKPVDLELDCFDPNITLDMIFAKAEEFYPNVELIVFCIPSSDNHLEMDYNLDNDEDRDFNFDDKHYNDIKYAGDIKYGIMTQCLVDEKVIHIPPGYLSDLLFKINGKMNGKNIILSSDSILPVMDELPMIVGVDVTHPGSNPSARDRSLTSIAAVVGSYDEHFIRYRACVRVQPENKLEIIPQFDEMMTDLLIHFKNVNNRLPQSIFVFRHGVSEGQFHKVMETEYQPLMKACKQLDPNYELKITVIIVVKRHNTRFMPFEVKFERGKPVDNIPAGTVVDTVIVNPIHREFYLCSHKGILGTSRLTRYVVLHDRNNMTNDEIQNLCYYLCFI